MACLLQLECNFLHGFFRCKLPVEVVDVEVKVTLMHGTHIFKRDRTTQLTKCIPWTMKIHPHPTIIKKMKTFLEVENKMVPTIPALASQFRPPLPETNPNFSKNDNTEKGKRATPKKKFRTATARVAMMHPPLLQAPPKSSNNMSSTPVREDTPWPKQGRGDHQQKRPLQKLQARRPDNLTKTRQQWKAEMERLNSMYNLDCFLDSELDSESDEGEQYQYEH